MNTLLTSELYKIWTPELIFVNTVRILRIHFVQNASQCCVQENKPRTVTDDKTSITVKLIEIREI